MFTDEDGNKEMAVMDNDAYAEMEEQHPTKVKKGKLPIE